MQLLDIRGVYKFAFNRCVSPKTGSPPAHEFRCRELALYSYVSASVGMGVAGVAALPS